MIKIAVLQEVEQLKNKLSGYVTLFSYRLANLCIKADPLSLLPIEIPTELGMQKFEEVCQAAQLDDYTFGIISQQEYIPNIQAGVRKVHPEFIQEIKLFNEEDPDTKYLTLTMPPVNKNRHDLLADGVNMLYNITKTQMEACFAKHSAALTAKTINYPLADKEDAKKALQDVYDQHVDMRDGAKKDKLAEIDEAYAHYQEEQSEKELSDHSKADEIGQFAGQSMKLS